MANFANDPTISVEPSGSNFLFTVKYTANFTRMTWPSRMDSPKAWPSSNPIKTSRSAAMTTASSICQ